MIEIIIIAQTVINISMVLWFVKHRLSEAEQHKRNEIWKEEKYKNQVRRLKAIRKRCDKYLDSVPFSLQTPDRQILVTHEDLVMIWDGTNHIQDNL